MLRYTAQRIDLFLFKANLAIANCSSLPFHSTKTKIATRIIVINALLSPSNLGIENVWLGAYFMLWVLAIYFIIISDTILLVGLFHRKCVRRIKLYRNLLTRIHSEKRLSWVFCRRYHYCLLRNSWRRESKNPVLPWSRHPN